MQRLLLLALVAVGLSISIGCSQSQTVKDSWKFTTRQYRTYLNTPAELNLDDKGDCELYELALGEAVLNVDGELHRLIRAMENSDHNPNQAWVMSMLQRFPWLTGVALVDGSGTLVAQYPEHFAKPFDAQPLMEADPKQPMGALRAYVQTTPAGPEVYVANPAFGNEEMRGLIIALFDPRVLATTSADPGAFVIASPAGVIWAGSFGDGSAVATHNWEETLKQKSCGLIGTPGSDFFWTTRYLGNLPLVYAVPVSAGKAQEAALQAAMPQDAKKTQEEPVAVAPEQKTDAQ